MKLNDDFLFSLGLPFSPIYSFIMRTRAFMYKHNLLNSRRLPVPVVSVGNLNMGGTGKTPLIIYIADLLKKYGLKPAIVSRGYRGSARDGINVVTDGHEILMTAAAAGDEPRLMAERLNGVPVLTGVRRAETGDYAVKNLGAEVVLMDDGFQHLALQRDLNIVLFRAPHFLKNRRVFPGGPLREPITALRRAHAFIITGTEQNAGEMVDGFKLFLRDRFPGIPVFEGGYRPGAILPAVTGDTPGRSAPWPMYAFCGIASPESFKNTLAENKYRITGFKAFRDHHRYSMDDLEELRAVAGRLGAKALITTEKDLVKLPPISGNGLPLLALRVELRMGDDFDSFLLERIRAV